MDPVALIVPVYKNFEGFAELMLSVDYPIYPIVFPNWKKNYGVSMGWNLGINKAIVLRYDYALVCNDDIVLDKGTIEKLVEAMPDYDMVTAVNTRDTELKPGYVEAPDFSCFMIRPHEFTEKFGIFDEGFSPAYFEDNDMHYRIKLAGGTAVQRTDAGMFHKGSVTQNWGNQQVVTGQMFETNRRYYEEKWGGTPGNERFTKPFGGSK